MNLSSIENIIQSKSSKMNKDECHKNLIEEIKKIVIKLLQNKLIYYIMYTDEGDFI